MMQPVLPLMPAAVLHSVVLRSGAIVVQMQKLQCVGPFLEQ